MVGPVLVVIAVVVVLLTLLGGPESEASTTTTLPAETVYASGLLVIEQGDAVPALVLLHARESGGLVLSLPGLTLLKTSNGYKTLAELHTSGQDGSLDAVLSEALGARVGSVATVQWAALRSAFVDAGLNNLPEESLTSAEHDNEKLADAVLALLGGSGSGNQASVWEGLPLEGDPSGFRVAVGEIVPSVASGGWTAAALTGRLVESAEFAYLEPDVEQAKALLSGAGQEPATTLQVQNGSGVVGIAEQAVELLAPMGYTMLPVGNAADFPDVEQTRIAVSPDALREGQRVRAFLGVGTVTEDDTLGSGHIVVVLGKDYVPPTTIDGEPAG